MMEDQNFYWDWIKHEDVLFTARMNFFLVGESILFGAALVTNTLPLTILCLVGVIASATWLWINISQSFLTVHRIVTKLEEVEPRWREINVARRPWVYVDLFVGILLPCSFLILWLILILTPVGG